LYVLKYFDFFVKYSFNLGKLAGVFNVFFPKYYCKSKLVFGKRREGF